MENRSGDWYYFSAITFLGLGNRTLAVDHARQAVAINPYQQNYQYLLNHLESNGTWNQGMGSPFSSRSSSGDSMCMQLCLNSLMCSMCFGC